MGLPVHVNQLYNLWPEFISDNFTQNLIMSVNVQHLAEICFWLQSST